MHRVLRVAVAVAAGGVLLALSSSCIEERLAPEDRNRPPDTFITGAPKEGSDAGVNVHFFWRGYDEDGTVLSYIYAIDDTTFTNWRPTSKTDSVFLFGVLPEEPTVPHTFYVASVDNEGKRDPTPASRSFTAVDLAPPLVTSIWGTYVRPPDAPVFFSAGDTVPAPAPGGAPYEVIVHWTGSDDDGTVVRYFWNLGDAPPLEVPYTDTTTADLGTLEPKSPEDRTRHVLFVVAEDDAGLQGGGGAAGVEPAELPFTVDFTPRTIIDSVLAMGTQWGSAWDPVGFAHNDSTPPDTAHYDADQVAQSDVSPLTFPANGAVRVFYHSTDPEDGCIKDIRWQAAAGLMDGGTTSGNFTAADNCDGVTSSGAISTERLTPSATTNPLKLWARARDAWNRIEEPGPDVNILVNFLPVVVIDSVRADSTGMTFRWHATDPDQAYSETRYRISLDKGSRIEVGEDVNGASHTYTPAQYDPTSGSVHTFVVEAANDLTVGRFNIADTTFVIDDVMTVKP